MEPSMYLISSTLHILLLWARCNSWRHLNTACLNIGRVYLHVCTFLQQIFWEKTRLGKASFRIEVLTLVRIIMENRLRHARGTIHFHIKSARWMTPFCMSYLYLSSSTVGQSSSSLSERLHSFWLSLCWHTLKGLGCCNTFSLSTAKKRKVSRLTKTSYN